MRLPSGSTSAHRPSRIQHTDQQYHDSTDLIREFQKISIAGRFGHHNVYLALSQHYYWPGMPEAVKCCVQACPTCQRVHSTPLPCVQIYRLEASFRPFQQISLDWLTALPASKGDEDAVLNVIDKCSKWALIITCTEQMTTE